MEEANFYGFHHLDADVRLPNRKRLLAGLKKQICDCSSLILSSVSIDSGNCLRNLLISVLRASVFQREEVVDASRSVAIAAAKVAGGRGGVCSSEGCSCCQECKLELVSFVSEKTSCKERSLRKNKANKHVPVKFFYKKRHTVENCKADEELACRLRPVMNSSPRIEFQRILNAQLGNLTVMTSIKTARVR